MMSLSGVIQVLGTKPLTGMASASLQSRENQLERQDSTPPWVTLRPG
jgi:hypothetical protein